MGLDALTGNHELQLLMRNELKKNKSSGTYLFYGRNGTDIFGAAKSFAKALFCSVDEYDFCDSCRECHNVNKEVHTDLNIIEPDGDSIKIKEIRSVIEEASKSSYEGGKKVFIIKEVNKLRREAANALLKTIEEPLEGVFFLLLSHDKKILPTIRSRSFLFELKPMNHEELEIDKKTFDFFEGNIQDILNNKEKKNDLESEISYKEIYDNIKSYSETGEFEYRANIIMSINDFSQRIKFLSDLDKIDFADNLYKAIGKDRKLVREILHLIVLKNRKNKNIEKLLEIKESINYNVSLENVLYNFMLSL